MMRARLLVLLPIIAFLLTSSTAGALGISGACSVLFSRASPIALPGAASFAGSVAAIAFLIVLIVLLITGIAYAIGYAFGIASLLRFVRSEAVESFFTLLIIALVAFGIGFAGPAMQFLSYLGSLSLSAGVAPSVSNAQGLYTTLCTDYITNGIVVLITDTVSLSLTFVVISTLQSYSIALAPNAFGVTYSPFYGSTLLLNILNTQIMAYALFEGILIAISLLLALIFFLFPFFLYAGVLLRAFPWTRAAGGSLIALFIAFYIVFPALLYPFAAEMPNSITTASRSLVTPGTLSSLQLSIASEYASISGSVIVNEVMGPEGFAQNVAMLVLQLIGIFVAFLVSFDLLEVLGDMLGSPSLQSNKIFSKVI